MNTLNQFTYEVNGNQIVRDRATKHREISFSCQVNVGRGRYDKVTTQVCKNLVQHVDVCNKNGWQIMSVTMREPVLNMANVLNDYSAID